MNFEVRTAVSEKDKERILNLMQLYTYELSFFEDETTHFNLMDSGLYELSEYIDLFWKEEKRFPYILRCDGKLCGFVLVRFNEEGYNEISEFFVLNKYRRSGAGKFMANEMFKLYHGKWEIRTLLKNKRAQDFWRNVVSKISDGDFEEKLIRDNSRHAFYFKN